MSSTSTYENDRAWSDKYLKRVRHILAEQLIETAPIHEDRNEASDLIVLPSLAGRIAVRIRRLGYAEQYPHEITLRSFRASGAKCEYHKIIEGYGDLLFFGHAAQQGIDICRWHMIDLAKLRGAIKAMNFADPESGIKYQIKTYFDQTHGGDAIKIDALYGRRLGRTEWLSLMEA